ncbi:MAG: hypothetical protein PVI66_09150 [Candidatus Aminicenantes bacterium]
MKFKGFSLLVVLVLFLTLLVCDNGNSYEEVEPTPEFEAMIRYTENSAFFRDNREALGNLENQIGNDQEVLKKFFLENKFVEMAQLMGHQTYIVRADYVMLTGQWQIAEYFSQEKKKKEELIEDPANQHVELVFTTEEINITAKEIRSGMEESEYDAFALELFNFTIEIVENGKTIKNTPGSGGTGRCHQNDCTWGRCR